MIAPSSGGPAEAAGIAPREVLQAVDGTTTQGLSLFDVGDLLQGPEGSQVILPPFALESIASISTAFLPRQPGNPSSCCLRWRMNTSNLESHPRDDMAPRVKSEPLDGGPAIGEGTWARRDWQTSSQNACMPAVVGLAASGCFQPVQEGEAGCRGLCWSAEQPCMLHLHEMLVMLHMASGAAVACCSPRQPHGRKLLVCLGFLSFAPLARQC